MNSHLLPTDLREYLSEPQNLDIALNEGEILKARLHPADRVPLSSFDVDSYELFSNGPLTSDPEETREYSGLDLVADCEAYDPEGILVWFPEWQRYGSWDCDHHTIITFPDVSWTDIVKAPTWYFNGQWYPEKVKHEEINPWA